MPFETIERKKPGSIPNDLAALLNRRLVSASETNEGTRLNEGRVKGLTGCDPITARFLHAEFFTFDPVAKFWLAVNHKPVVRDDSHGFWRRIRLVPFTQVFDVDPALAGELAAEAPGILAWAVRGCLHWQAQGLDAPATVLQATKDYEQDSDPLHDFISAACNLDVDAEVSAKEMYDHYRLWAERQGLKERDPDHMTMTRFGTKLSEQFPHRKVHGTKYYRRRLPFAPQLSARGEGKRRVLAPARALALWLGWRLGKPPTVVLQRKR